MKKCLLSILLATVLLYACAQQTDNTLQTPESSTLVELTVATEETAIETPAPLATESPAPASTQTPEPTATPAPTEIPIPEPTAAPTEAPATESAVTASQPAQVSMSYGAVPLTWQQAPRNGGVSTARTVPIGRYRKTSILCAQQLVFPL